MKKLFVLLVSVVLFACTKEKGYLLYSDIRRLMPTLPDPPRYPDSIATRFYEYNGGGDSIKPRSIGYKLFYFDYYTVKSYPGDPAEPQIMDLATWGPYNTPLARTLFDSVFNPMRVNAGFLKNYGLAFVYHFKELPDTTFIPFWYDMDELAK